MIVDHRVLTAEFQPTELKHRHDEIQAVSRHVEPVSETDPMGGSGVFVAGPSGAGKTCTTAYLLGKLEEETGIGHHIINCWTERTSAGIYHHLLNKRKPAHTRKRGTTAKSVVWEELAASIDEPVVIVLDEVDQLTESQVLYQFFEHEQIIPVYIANRKSEFVARLDERVQSRLRSYPTIKFNRYTDAELVSILETRAEAALEPDVVSQSDLQVIAASSEGDARLAIATLRNAVGNAEGVVQSFDINAAIRDANSEVLRESLAKITDEQHAVLEELSDGGEQSLNELYDRYCERVSDPKVKRTIRGYVAKMVDYGLIKRYGSGKASTYTSLVDDLELEA